MACNQDCEQGDKCDCGTPFKFSELDIWIAVTAAVFALSCFGYLIGGWR